MSSFSGGKYVGPSRESGSDELARLLEFDEEVDDGDAAEEAGGSSLLDELHVMEGEAVGGQGETERQDSECPLAKSHG